MNAPHALVSWEEEKNRRERRKAVKECTMCDGDGFLYFADEKGLSHADKCPHEETLALRNQINDRLAYLDSSVASLIRPEFLLELAEVIKDRRLGMWAAPSAVETAALSVRRLGLSAAIESARPLAEDEEAKADEEI